MEYKVTDIINVFYDWIILLLPYIFLLIGVMVVIVKVTKDKAIFSRILKEFFK